MSEDNKKCAGSSNREENSKWTDGERLKAEEALVVSELEALEAKVSILEPLSP